jgi:sulfoxide reductase heme-binding subunit YedZ
MHTYQAKLPLQATKDKERTQQIIEQLLLLCANRWQSLHNTIYLVVLLTLLHFSWSRKTGLQEPLIYWAIALLILLPRLQYLKQRLQRARLSRNSM